MTITIKHKIFRGFALKKYLSASLLEKYIMTGLECVKFLENIFGTFQWN